MTVDFTRESMPTVQETIEADGGTPPPPPYVGHHPRSFGTGQIPVERYISADYQRLEYERLWSRVWQWACNSEDIPEVGDHIVYEIGEKSVIVVRAAEPTGDDSGIRAYHNACLHRGRQLKTQPGNSRQLVCGFHGWTWNLDGSLARIPCRWDFPQITDEDNRLPEVRCETWSQFVFVNFDDDAAPLVESLDILPEHFKHFPLDDKFTAAHVSKVIPANWKVTMEAFLESYHEIATHPQLLEWTADANTQYDVWDRTSRLYTMTAMPSPHLGEVDPGQVYEAAAGFFAVPGAPPPSPDLPEGATPREAIAGLTRDMMSGMLGLDISDKSTSEIIDAAQYFVFPNWCPWSGVANALQYRFRPNGDDPHSCIFDVRMMYTVPPGAPRPPSAPVHVLQPGESWTNAPELAGFCQVMDQDEGNLVAIQRGLRATKRTGVNFGEYQESRIRHFHALLDEYMGLDGYMGA
ncbi:MAG TPA: aromatic ring-hydroxylating dioxygenase subunit alpha [Pseudonocardia sp.]|nr:aromatic ring-hydroxylating dioxygenase subunit alpha [Pseudonocardia sp.]